MNANLEFAYAGIGKALLRQGDYKGCHDAFQTQLGPEKLFESIPAIPQSGHEEHFPLIMTMLFLAGIGIFSASRLRKVKERRKGASA